VLSPRVMYACFARQEATGTVCRWKRVLRTSASRERFLRDEVTRRAAQQHSDRERS